MAPKSLTTLLSGIVDYAGLFPPAELTMSGAVKNFADHFVSADAWMLGRFVLPLSRIDEFEQEAEALLPLDSSPWRLSVLGSQDFQREADIAHAFNERNRGAIIDTVEIQCTRVEEILAAASVYPKTMRVFIEIPLDKDPAGLLKAVADAKVNAKIRTGGISVTAFPTSEAVVHFIRSCVAAGVQFKATAGLHHPIRARYKLTYKPESESGVMFGFLNVFLAAAFIRQGISDEEAIQILNEESITAFHFDESGVTWRLRQLSLNDLKSTRSTVAASFGSCSFREPVDDLKTLQYL